MLLIIYGHSFPPNPTKMWVYSFHLPLFFFISGYLFKQRSLSETVKRKIKTLLIPYFVTALISLPIGYLILKFIGKSTTELFYDFFYLKGSVGWNVPIWFLIVLFWVEVIFAVTRALNINEYVTVILAFSIGYFIYIKGIFLPFGINIAVWLLPFYLFGYLFKIKNVVKKLSELSRKVIIPAGTMLIILCGILGNLLNRQIPEPYHNVLGIFWVYFMVASIGIIGNICFFLKIKHVNILSVISKNSLFILCTQYFYFWTVRFFFLKFFGNKLVQTNYIESLLIFILCITFYVIYFYIKSKTSNKMLVHKLLP